MRKYVLLWVLCVVGAWTLLPYAHYLGVFPTDLTMRLLLISTAQTMLFYGIVCWLAYKVVPKTDLYPFEMHDPLKRIVYPGIIGGIGLGLVLFGANKLLFQSMLDKIPLPPLWARGLASIYGGVNEEVLLRLFLFSGVYWVMGKFLRLKRIYLLWSANVIVAIAFGVAHLPIAFALTQPTSVEIFRILLLNGIAGLAFGSLYWNLGIWTVILAHFVADLMIHVFLI